MKLTLLGIFSLFFGFFAQAYTNELNTTPGTFSAYKPIYFISGRPDTKVQVSVKMQVVENLPLYFAYSQIMIWELRKPSDPMLDIDYAPEVFYRWRMGGDSPTEWVDVGFEHESNGKDGWDTRSWNRSYLRYFKRWSLGSFVKLDTSLRAWVPYGYDEMSHDLPKSRGIYEGFITFSHFLGDFMRLSDLTFRFTGGGNSFVDPSKGANELTLRLKFWGEKFVPGIVFQVFDGYGENMLETADHHFAWRVGIGL